VLSTINHGKEQFVLISIHYITAAIFFFFEAAKNINNLLLEYKIYTRGQNNTQSFLVKQERKQTKDTTTTTSTTTKSKRSRGTKLHQHSTTMTPTYNLTPATMPFT
jgi:hypothetical protein